MQTPLSTLTLALKMRSEGMGIRASGRVFGKSHANIIRMRHSDDIALPIAVTRTSMPRQPMGYDEP